MFDILDVDTGQLLKVCIISMIGGGLICRRAELESLTDGER